MNGMTKRLKKLVAQRKISVVVSDQKSYRPYGRNRNSSNNDYYDRG